MWRMRALCLSLYTYIYVVIVNKGDRFLWITRIFTGRSRRYRFHNPKGGS